MQAAVSVGVFAHDVELREWLVDELALISPTLAVHELEALGALGAAPVLIVELDTLSVAEVEHVGALASATPVIAIGAPPAQLAAAPFAHVLDAKLTSKELKRAVRETLARPR